MKTKRYLTCLIIQGSAEGWWYVQLPGGELGWVMATDTTLKTVKG